MFERAVPDDGRKPASGNQSRAMAPSECDAGAQPRALVIQNAERIHTSSFSERYALPNALR